jgi:hypothetical protein
MVVSKGKNMTNREIIVRYVLSSSDKEKAELIKRLRGYPF